ncbi:MAG: hypothetical protein QGH12_11660, partial [SAR324 cluster bacterium]|nr:hypothetical protein [SAR324 cluster bacterium]
MADDKVHSQEQITPIDIEDFTISEEEPEKPAENVNRHVLCSVAADENTPVELLEKLIEDKDHHVRCSVAANKKTPVETLEKLAV